jgi:CubicO group peptidase (beta-lactamase class C family)
LFRKLKILIFILLISLLINKHGAVENTNIPFEKLVPENIRLTNSISSGEKYAGIEKNVNSFMRKWEIAGASIAVAYEGKLIFARGFGYADTASKAETQPYNKFRIASISKLVTAAAIMKLQEEGKLSLNDRVFGIDGILNDPFYSNPSDKRAYGITVAHLLSHEGGWTQRYGDQMFMPVTIANNMGLKPPVDTKTIVRFALNKRLHFTPGTGKAYSNLGYSILGLIVEKASGLSYEEYCKRTILEPIGINDMTIAGNLPSQRAPFEVTYYQPVDIALKPSIYGTGELVVPTYGGNDIEALGGAGAWIATAPDLMRLLLAVDGSDTRKDILSDQSINFMTDNNNGFAPIGWKNTGTNGTWSRTGSFPGTSGMLKRQSDGLAWVILLNSSTWNGPEIYPYINSMMSKVLNQIDKSFEYDLFQNSLPIPLNISYSKFSFN